MSPFILKTVTSRLELVLLHPCPRAKCIADLICREMDAGSPSEAILVPAVFARHPRTRPTSVLRDRDVSSLPWIRF